MKMMRLMLVAAAMAVPASALAQVSTEEFDKLKARVAELEKANGKLTEQLKRVLGAAEEQGAAIKELSQDAIENKKGFAFLVERVRDNDIKLEDLVKRDPENKQKYIFDVMGNMQRSAAFRGDLHTATTGRLVITNETPREQYLYVNGTLWRVIRGRSYVTVPRGTISVQRPGAAQETLENWQYDQGRGFVLPYVYAPPPPSAPPGPPPVHPVGTDYPVNGHQ